MYEVGAVKIANDITLLKLAEDLNIKDDPNMNVICLPPGKTGTNEYDSSSCTVSGWGLTGMNQNT